MKTITSVEIKRWYIEGDRDWETFVAVAYV